MKKSLYIIAILLVGVFFLSACSTKDGRKFKEEYESLNGKTNAYGKEHRSVNIPKNNPFVYATAEDIIKKMENGETFYVYFGDKLCPWCRSVIEKAVEVSKEYKVKEIYYVAIWDDEGNEILRDKYSLDEKNKLKLEQEGTDAYKKLLVSLGSVLSDYNLTSKDGKSVSVDEKRIYAPNFIYIEDGFPTKMTEGISKKQTDSREKLSKEILEDEEKMFKDFFNNKEDK